jgi:hypothetical protein
MTREPWVWLFSDDDVIDEGCVAAFLGELQETEEDHDVYRFNTDYCDRLWRRPFAMRSRIDSCSFHRVISIRPYRI